VGTLISLLLTAYQFIINYQSSSVNQSCYQLINQERLIVSSIRYHIYYPSIIDTKDFYENRYDCDSNTFITT
jgi:hypothetical protein